MKREGRGGPAPTPVMLRLVDILEDGEWHDVEAVIREVGKAIPPGRAMRRTEVRRNSNKPRQRPLSPERAVESGRRSIVRDTFHAGRASFQLDPVAGPSERVPQRVRMVSLPPSVARHRKLAAEGRLINDDLLDALIASEDPRATLAPFDSRRHLEDVVVALLGRLRAEEDR